jgi:hypothetical protein
MMRAAMPAQPHRLRENVKFVLCLLAALTFVGLMQFLLSAA